MSTPGFTADDDALRRREEAVARVADVLGQALDAARVASDPAAYGLLCRFFPALVLGPAEQQVRDALARAQTSCARSATELRDAATAFTETDSNGAGGFGG